jgi:hypothetical protein
MGFGDIPLTFDYSGIQGDYYAESFFLTNIVIPHHNEFVSDWLYG